MATISGHWAAKPMRSQNTAARLSLQNARCNGPATFTVNSWDFENYLAETDDQNEIQTVYTNEPRKYGNLISQYRKDGAIWTPSYYQYDALGSTRALTDDGGDATDTYLYDGWGNEVATMGTTVNSFRWVGRVGYYWDEGLGTFYIRARVYEPVIGRWMSMDPLGFVDGPNLYTAYFVPGTVDPSGKAQEGLQIPGVVIKRNHIRWSVVLGTAQGDGYGHYWTVIDDTESYGWWPSEPVDGLASTLTGVPGELNARHFGGTATTDPHHPDTAETEFTAEFMIDPGFQKFDFGSAKGTRCSEYITCPGWIERLIHGYRPTVDPSVVPHVKDCLRKAAAHFDATHDTWSYPTGWNCHRFQYWLLTSCCLAETFGQVYETGGS